MTDRVSLLRSEMATLWVADERGRLDRSRASDPRPPPLLAVAATPRGMVWASATSLPSEVAGALDRVLAGTRPPDGEPLLGWEPEPAASLLELLAPVAPTVGIERGPSYVVTRAPPAPAGIECWAGSGADRERLAGLMSERDRRSLLDPWAVAVTGGRVAAVCETARSAPTGVEAGVWTYEPYRRPGFGAAATAAWASLVTDRPAFYSTSAGNVASQGLARRLGLTPLGQWWTVRAAPTGAPTAR